MLEPKNDWEIQSLAEENRWAEVEAILEEIVATGNFDVKPLCRLALVNLERGDDLAYRKTCQRLLAAYNGAETAGILWKVGWRCALRAGAIKSFDTLLANLEELDDTKKTLGRANGILCIASERLWERYSFVLGATKKP